MPFKLTGEDERWLCSHPAEIEALSAMSSVSSIFSLSSAPIELSYL